MSNFKDSGVEWLGVIPDHWEKLRLKFVYNIKKAKLPSKFYDDNSLTPYLSMDYIRGKDVVLKYAEDGDLVEEDDILLLWDGSKAGEIILDHPKGYAPSTTAILSKNHQKLINDYGKFYLKFMEIELKKNTNGMGIPHVDGNFLKSMPFLLPPISEQKEITNYLNKKCSDINEISHEIKEQVQILKEYKLSLISEVVTRGLDDNVSLKDSGVEWIDKIPENWRTSKIKSVCSINSGEYVSKNDYVDNGKYDIMGANGKIGNINKKNVYEEVLIMGRVGTIGTFFIVKDVWVSDNALIIKNNTHINLRFLYYVLKLLPYDLLASGTAQPLITATTIKNQYIPLPSLKEQEEIAEYLDEKVSSIDEVIALKEEQLEVLKEYEKSLIYEYVTGKKEVMVDD